MRTTKAIIKQFITFICLCVSILILAQDAYAKKRPDKRAELVIDAQSGRILHSYKSDYVRHPASLTKLMTLYLTFEALDAGKITPDSKIVISKYAASRPPSKLGLKRGSSITVRDAIYTLIIKSANDVAAAVAEKLGGSEKKFAAMMTKKAKKIGMTRTLFKNASGLPDRRQVTTARDMAVLAIKLMRDFPHYYKYFKTLRKNVAGIRLRTHNHLLKTYKGMDGLKTGYINMSGFNLVSSAERNNKRLITVVMGGRTYSARDRKVAELTNLGWKRLKNPRGYKQFLGLTISNLAALHTKFRPLEDKTFNGTKEIKTASLVYKSRPIAMPKSENNSLINNQKREKPSYKKVTPKRIIPKKEKVSLQPMNAQEVKPKKLTKISAYYQLNNTKKAQKSSWSQPDGKESDIINALIDNSIQKKNYPDDPAFRENLLIKNAASFSKHHSWIIQVGAFSQKKIADNYLLLLINEYDHLSTAQPELIAVKKGKNYIYRARFTGLSARKAKESCKLLKKVGHHCVTASNAS